MILRIALGLVLIAVLPLPAGADESDLVASRQSILVASDVSQSNQFGLSVATDGDTAVIGANGDDEAGSNAGAAYVFVRSGNVWALESKLTAPDSALGGTFGGSVAISDNTIVVGASSGVYVFVRSGSGWAEEAKLLAGRS